MKNKENKKDFTSFISCMLIAIIGILVCVEGIYHTTKANAATENISSIEEPVFFHIENVGELHLTSTEDSYEFTYYVDSTDSYVNVFTSIIEGDYLRMYMDCLNLYSYNNSYEDTDALQSYLLNNSRLKYVDNQWYQGWIWVYDACPIYRFQHL